MIKSKFYTQVDSLLFEKRRQYFYTMLSMLMAVLMLAGVWGTTAVFAAISAIQPGQIFEVFENSASGTPVGTVQATDATSFAIVDGNDLGAFDIHSTFGEITVADGTQVNHETTPQFILTIRINDDSATDETVTINVVNMNDSPAFAESSYAFDLAENSNIGTEVADMSLEANDPDGDTMTYQISSWLIHGPFSIDEDTGKLTVQDVLNFETDPVVYMFVVKVTDGGLSGSTLVTVNLTDDNDPPVANDDTDVAYTVDEADTNLTIGLDAPDLLDNDTDEDDDVITVAVNSVTQPVNGSVTVASDGTFVYTPTAQFNGIDTFTYKAQDDGAGNPLSHVATVTITVTGDNDAPTAVDDSYSVAEEGTLTVLVADGVLDNDTDPENDILTAVIGVDVSTGSLNFDPNGSFIYTAPLDYAGIVTFTYQAQDDGEPRELSNMATVTITVSNENDPPTAVPDPSYTTPEDTPLSVSAPGVLDNDTDPDNGDSLTAHLDTDASNGTVTLQSDGAFIYTPTLNFNGIDTFTYHAKDSLSVSSNSTTVTITVQPDNDAPTAVLDPDYETNEDTTLTVSALGVLTNDTDPENDSLTAHVDTDVSSGTLTLLEDGSFIYTPTLNFNGIDTFTYHASDGFLSSNVTTVTITVQPQNDPPHAVDDPGYTTPEDTLLNVLADGVLGNDLDLDGDEITAVLDTNVSSGSLTLNPNGSFDYTPALNANGVVTFTYHAYDGFLSSNTATVTITINADNDAPVMDNQSFSSIDENSSVSTVVGTVAATDIEDDSLIFGLIPGGSGDGSFGISSAGQITVINNAALDMETTQSFTLTVVVSDTEPLTDTATITINLNNVNEFDPEITANQIYTITEAAANNSLVGIVAATDGDWPENPNAFVITGGNTDGVFDIDNDGNLIVLNNTALNFEATDIYTLTIQVTDDGTNPGTKFGTGDVVVHITDTNDAPVIDSVDTSPTVIAESEAVTVTVNFTDQDTGDAHTVSIDWGDGTSISQVSVGPGAGEAEATHTYADDDPSGTNSDMYTIDITVADDGDPSEDDTDTTSVTVNNVAPVLTNVALTPNSGDEGDSVVLTGDIADVGIQDTFSISVDWGDGSIADTYYYPAGTSMFTETHVFIDDGQPLNVQVTLTDDDTGEDTGSATITLNNVAPIAEAGPNQIVNVNELVDFAGSFIDPGTGDTHTFEWNFGDTTTDSGSLTPQHAFTAIGVYTATLTVTDDETASDSDQVVITVISPSDMVATKIVGGDFSEEGTIFYTITMMNTGDGGQLDNVGDELVDVLPAQLTLVDAQVVSGGGSVSATLATNTVAWNGSIASGSSVEISIEATILTGTKGVTVTNQATLAYDADGNGSNESTTYSDDPAVGGSYDPTIFEVKNVYFVFMPIILNNYTSAPDLVVTDINASSDLIEVVIENQGNAPVINSFWVDFYINPSPAPTAANELWTELAAEGLAWGVTDSLAVGETITLTFSTELGAPNEYFVAEESLYYGSLPAGTPVYAQADSAHAGIGNGAITELDELGIGLYNNILEGTAVSSTAP